MAKREILATVALLSVLLGSNAARAQAGDQAEKEFLAGDAAESRGQLDEACRHYRASLALRRVPGPLAGSARCDARELHFIAALAKLEEALAMLPPDHQQRAGFEADRARWKGKLARVSVVLRPGATVESVSLDGQTVVPRPEPYEVDPGQHVVRVVQGGAPQDRTLALSSGTNAPLEIPFTGVAAPDDKPATTPSEDGMSPWMTAAIVSFSVAGAAAAATIATGVMVLDRDSTAEELCTPTPEAGCDQAIDDTNALLAPNLAMWIVSGVALAAGVTFVIIDATSSAEPAARSQIGLRLGPSGVALSGSF